MEFLFPRPIKARACMLLSTSTNIYRLCGHTAILRWFVGGGLERGSKILCVEERFVTSCGKCDSFNGETLCTICGRTTVLKLQADGSYLVRLEPKN